MLAKLVAKGQKAPRKSIERAKILTQIISTMQEYELLSHLDKSQFPEGLDRDAMQKLLLEVCWNIDLSRKNEGASQF